MDLGHVSILDTELPPSPLIPSHHYNHALLVLPSLVQGGVDLGRISSLEKDHKPVDTARKGDSVAMKIEVGILDLT